MTKIEQYVAEYRKYLKIESTVEQGKVNRANQTRFDQLGKISNRMDVLKASMSAKEVIQIPAALASMSGK